MYKCKECGAEYEVKPDYCDCGNDEFIDAEPVIKEKPIKATEKNQSEQVISDKKTENESNIVRSASDLNFHNSKNVCIPKRTVSVDPFSLTIFCICILLSLYVLFFAFNSVNNATQPANEITEPSAHKNIPSIDKIWNNAVPVVKKDDKKEEKIAENIIKQIIPIQAPKKTETVQKITTVKPKVTTVPLKKVPQKTQAIKSTIAVTKQQSNISEQEHAKNAAELVEKQKAEQERKAAEAAQLKKLQEEQAKRYAEQKAKQAQAEKQEFINYKAQLRNTIAKKIDFTRVIGDGSCVVSFRIDSNGKLTNRSFAKQSSNNTLNDAVYAAVMSTPVFNQPPTAYNNEILNLNIKFYNGNFEISLP